MAKFVSRRGFMIGGGVLGGAVVAGMAVGVGYLSTVDTLGMSPGSSDDGMIGLNAWINISTEGEIVFAIPHSEMGQGIHTGLAMLIAEELEVGLDQVRVEHPTELLPVYANFVLALNKRPEEMGGAVDWLGKRIFGLVPYIATGGSTSIVLNWRQLRVAGASVREMLKMAAAEKMGVPAGKLKAENGQIVDPDSGQVLGFGELASAAAQFAPPENVALKSRPDWKLVGKSQNRLDIPDKVQGKAVFGIDARPEGGLCAVIAQCPIFGGKVKSMDGSTAAKMPGVVDVVNLENAVAVIADNTWKAKQALEAVDVEWDDAGNRAVSSAGLIAKMKAATKESGYVARDDGDVDAAKGEMIEVEYITPYLAHACLEPMNASAIVHDADSATVWSSVQTPLAGIWGAQSGAGTDGVTAHVTLNGGAFGRRSESDATTQAAKLAAHLKGRPVQAIWTREEDTQHDMYRPAAVSRMRARLGPDGYPQSWEHAIGTQSVMLSFSGRNLPVSEGGDNDQANVEGAKQVPYAIPNVRVSAKHVDSPIPLGFWRSVGHSNNGYFVESFIDELAATAGADPAGYRRKLLAGQPRHLRVLEELVAKSGWGKKPSAGRGFGIALHESFRSVVGQVAEVVVEDGDVRIEKITCVADCGQIVNPQQVIAQMEGGIIFALSALAYGEITVEDGQVVQSNFHDYDMVRMEQCPEIDVHLIDTDDLPGGAGEPGTPPAFAAVTNAIFNATGTRVRELPISKAGFTLV